MIYPVPQKAVFGEKLAAPVGFLITGDCSDFAASFLNKKGFKTAFDGFSLKISVKSTEKTAYIKEYSRLTDEKYFLDIDCDGASVEAATVRGLFRALNTLVKLVESGDFCACSIEDYPLFEKRGYIEGFYGKPWADGARLSVMQLMSENGMNTYYYAPKDDLYHREKWYEKYPEEEFSKLKELFSFAKEKQLDVFWCVGPGLSYHYSDDGDYSLLLEKLKSVYFAGVTGFGLLLDDIPREFQYDDDAERYDSPVDAHIELINRLYRDLKSFDSALSLTVCPTQYSGDENGYYISKFGRGIPSDVSLFWTGEEICSRVLTCRESDELLRSTSHKPLFWDNYPVNDAEMFQEMHLDGIEGRDRELFRHCEGLISNVMEYAECSKIPLLTIADYLWNPLSYDKEKSLAHAHRELLGEKAELFSLFADHLGVSCLSKYSSAYMSEILEKVWFALLKGEKETALGILGDYISRCEQCVDMLSETDVPLFCELAKWSEKFRKSNALLRLIAKQVEYTTEENTAALAKALDEYNADAVLLTGFCLRDAAQKALELHNYMSGD